MARGVNKVILVGNLGKDPDVKYTAGGVAVTRFSLATTSYRKVDGEQREDTQWHRVVAFGKLGEIAGEYLKAGRQVYVEGELRYEKRTVEGVDRYYTDVVAAEIQFLGGEGGGGGQGRTRSQDRSTQLDQRQPYGGRQAAGGRQPAARDPAPREGRAPAPAPYTGGGEAGGFDDDDIPF